MRHLLLALALAGCASAPTLDVNDVRGERAEAALRERGFIGSALVACDDRVLFSSDFGVSDPAGRTPSYWGASISKGFTAAAILKLAEEGRLGLDDPISRFFPDAPADKATITLTQLLTHMSGLPQAYAADGIADRDEAARAILGGALGAEPGAAFAYSNDNFTLLAMIVEIASGTTFEDYVGTSIFAPAGLQDSGFWPDTGDEFVPPLLAPPDGPAAAPNWGFRGGIGMRMSARDLLAWANALDEGRVLSRESVALLYGPHVTRDGGISVGMGWYWSDEPSGRWYWTRGYDMVGGNAVLYRLVGSPLIIIAATNAGPAEDSGPGWSRVARDALMEIYDASACAES